MGLEKAIKHGKEHRKSYYGSKAVDQTCRNHSSCPWCMGNRLYHRRKLEQAASDSVKDYLAK